MSLGTRSEINLLLLDALSTTCCKTFGFLGVRMQTAIDQELCWMQMYHCLTPVITLKAAMTDYICHGEGGFLVRLILHGAQPFPFSFSTSTCLYMVLA